jgi:hypothetical protein
VRLTAHGTTACLDGLIERLRSSGSSVSRAATAEDLAADHDAEGLVVVVSERVPAAITSLPQARAGKLILFIEQITPATEVDLLAFETTLAAMLVKQGTFEIDEMARAIEKAFDPAPLGLERYLTDAGATEHVVLNQSLERGGALGTLDRFVSGHGLDARRVAQILTLADELITNAFYHAPVDGTGGHPYSHLSRMDVLECKHNRAIELAFARNDDRVAVSVRDRYGSLEQPRIRSHLTKAITNNAANFRVSGGPGGAKLGLITAIRAASQLVFNVVPGELTECVGIIETHGTYRQFLESGKTLELFSFPALAVPPPPA